MALEVNGKLVKVMTQVTGEGLKGLGLNKNL
jgi:hypothetical protein